MTNYCEYCECDSCLEQDYISHYNVWGGEFKDIEDRDSIIGDAIDFGEYDTYQEALDVWNYEMRRNLDNHHYRVFIDTIYMDDDDEIMEDLEDDFEEETWNLNTVLFAGLVIMILSMMFYIFV